MIEDEEGPVPMINMKPVKKNPNAADNFSQANQTEYETHGETQNMSKHVDRHNKACPKLIDELEKRLSISKPTAIPAQKNASNRQKSTVCGSKRKMSDKTSGGENKRTAKRKYRENKSRSRVTKSRKPQRKKNKDRYRGAQLNVSRGIQYYNQFTENKGTSPLSLPSCFNMAETKMQTNELGSFSGHAVEESQNGEETAVKDSNKSLNSNDGGSTKYPNTSIASVSSYNSFMSMSHEPMVSP